MSPEESEMFMTDVHLCKNETGATDADVADLYNRVLPTTKPAKCFNACVFDKIEIVSHPTDHITSVAVVVDRVCIKNEILHLDGRRQIRTR